ncbi:copper resistance protein B [Aurantiacibacter spongiae]|uniref:Copper resistance protein B n=1 Tax=Aurantiacibacter spongiae TaxID=2488860 RepID=A0A3N5DJV3_9SPHN|nr:copper resistance protein B [Aurantiacibacter spongiae]RPF71015.1 copper resistance protein B [Aurantiacibacter spongiae]
MRTSIFSAFLLGATATPVLAQGHSAHGNQQTSAETGKDDLQDEESRAGEDTAEAASAPAVRSDQADHHAMDHGSMAHGAMEPGTVEDTASGDGAMDHSAMNHAAVDHTAMGHSVSERESALIPILPPPPEAGFGPPVAADAIWGAEAMHDSRGALARENGRMMTAGLFVDRLEYRSREGEDGYLWDASGWYGGDLDRIWLKSEGEGRASGDLEHAFVTVLYGRAVSPWFDARVGLRRDLTGPTRTYIDAGIQGLAPYLFELEADLYLSTNGDLTARAEVELDQSITQRLILQPRAEIALAVQDVPELGIGAGIDTVETGLRLRYEIARELAPYVGVAQEWKLGGSADFARAAGEEASATNVVVGIRFWF